MSNKNEEEKKIVEMFSEWRESIIQVKYFKPFTSHYLKEMKTEGNKEVLKRI